MASSGIVFRCINSFGTYKNLLTSRICNQLYQQTATLKVETKKKLESLKIPEGPKRPITPYLRFFLQNREFIKKQHPDWKLTDITKQCSQDWKNAEDGVKQQIFNEYAKALEVYDKQQIEYTASLTEEQIEAIKMAKSEKKQLKIKRAVKKRYRETSKPKRPLGSFLYFIKDKWELAENKKKKLPELLQAYKGEWNSMSDLNKEKYNALNETDRKRYKAEMLKWEAKMVQEGNFDIIRKDSQIVKVNKDDNKASEKYLDKQKHEKPKTGESIKTKKSKSD